MGCNYLGFFLVMATNICCSIETEPKTLSQDQLNQAREVAADVVQKMKEKEASSVFIKVQEGVEEEEKNEEKLQKEEQFNIANNKEIQVIERPCQCSVNNIAESPDQINLEEPLSAPF
ncbi:hypothetical protein Pint_29642 [Pistacia integerrima]|uniref:Uncharacterized protein n=1 Tax=Pistacia integerrima TaxID=434235 RepID=A0ACC0X1K3_9ROSI|nr:hypothetical protein Pint_29642 [Pistacia integerrima]